MKTKIIAEDKSHLKKLIQDEIKQNGSQCDLNHINVSNITDMIGLFREYDFNGNISNWDVSNVINMSDMFLHSTFNNNISKWNVSNVKNMSGMFYGSSFTGDLSDWKPYKLIHTRNIFNIGSDLNFILCPYWLEYEVIDERRNKKNQILYDVIDKRNKAIDIYHLEKELNSELNINNQSSKQFKI